MTESGKAAGPVRWSPTDAREWLSPPDAKDHKVSRGVLGARIGSARYPGAAVLGVSAAWRTGAGMVRYAPPLADLSPAFGLPSPAFAVLAARPETLFGEGPCTAWLIGSGTDPSDRSSAEQAALNLLQDAAAPLIVDAGALDTALERVGVPTLPPAVLTPHGGEFRRLWDAAHLGEFPDHSTAACRLAAHLSATILLKGSTSLIASPRGRLIAVGPATPWLATAGTGDVLAGILGSLVAGHAAEVGADRELLAPLAATAALVHDVAARIASGDDSTQPDACTGAPITALEVVNAIPAAIRWVRDA